MNMYINPNTLIHVFRNLENDDFVSGKDLSPFIREYIARYGKMQIERFIKFSRLRTVLFNHLKNMDMIYLGRVNFHIQIEVDGMTTIEQIELLKHIPTNIKVSLEISNCPGPKLIELVCIVKQQNWTIVKIGCFN